MEDPAEATPPWSASTALLAAALTLLGWLLAGCAHVAPPPGPEPQTQAQPQSQPLYQRLGGVEAIQRLSTRVLDRTAGDARTGASFTGVNRRVLDRSVADYLCRAADGPCVYEGETMRNSHADLGITGSQFDLMVQFLREELDAAGVPQSAKNELLRRLAPTRRDIVQR
ncbi:MAG: group I truncated hemoglobin [Pseudomonadota bacterium]